MTNGIDNSVVTILLLTKRYLAKCDERYSNLNNEFVYASKKGKEYLLPIIMEEEVLDEEEWSMGVVNYHIGDMIKIPYATPMQQRENLIKIVTKIKLNLY